MKCFQVIKKISHLVWIKIVLWWNLKKWKGVIACDDSSVAMFFSFPTIKIQVSRTSFPSKPKNASFRLFFFQEAAFYFLKFFVFHFDHHNEKALTVKVIDPRYIHQVDIPMSQKSIVFPQWGVLACRPQCPCYPPLPLW